MNKCIVILVIVMLLSIGSAKAGYAEYLLIDPPDPTTSWMLMTDGQGSINNLMLHSLRVDGASDMSINSGMLGILGVGDTSIVNVYKANVLQATTIDSGTIIFHALDFKFEGDYVFREFENATLKTKLHQGNFIFHSVPELSTMVLLGSGLLLVFGKRRFKKLSY